MDNDKFLEEIIVTFKDIQKLQNIANAKHGWNDKIHRYYDEKWGKMIEDAEKRIGE